MARKARAVSHGASHARGGPVDRLGGYKGTHTSKARTRRGKKAARGAIANFFRGFTTTPGR